MAEATIKALVITASNRAAAGVYPDRSGPVLAELLGTAGCAVDGPLVVPDGEPVEAALRSALADGYDVVVTTGGTGLTPGDLTPEMTRRVIEREVPGIAEALRAAGAAARSAVGDPFAWRSRGGRPYPDREPARFHRRRPGWDGRARARARARDLPDPRR